MRKGWIEKTLGECCVGRPAYGANAPSVDYDLKLPRYLRITDISEDGNLIASDPRSINEKDAEGNYLNNGDIVFARSGATAGKTYLHQSNDILAYAGYLIRFRPNSSVVLPEYLFLYTRSDHYKTWIKNNVRAGAQPNINAQEYSSINILLPPLAEQKKIAVILRTWDDAIEKQDKIVSGLQKKRKALLGKLLLKQQVNKPLKYFAKPIAREIDKPTSAYHALGLRSHCKGTFQRFIKDAATVAMETLYQVRENDLIVNITFAWEGAIALVKKDDEHCLVSHRFPTYEIDTSKALPQFIRHVVQTKKFIETLGIISPGGAGRNRVLSKKDFLELKIWLPDLSTQSHIVDIISTLELEIETATALLKKFKTQKRGLMQKLLTGAWPVLTSGKEAA